MTTDERASTRPADPGLRASRFDVDGQEMLVLAERRVLAREGADIGTADLLWAACQTPAARAALRRGAVDPTRVADRLQTRTIAPRRTSHQDRDRRPRPTPTLTVVVGLAERLGRTNGCRAGPESLVAALLLARYSRAAEVMRSATYPRWRTP